MKKNAILSGAIVLGAGSLIAKILGAIYRIPLTNLLGSQGLGLYQMVFPLYCVLLDFSGLAVPSALSKIIASNKDNKEEIGLTYFYGSIRLFSIIGAIFSIFMVIFAKPLSILQGNEKATLSYIFLAPSVLAVSLISCFRGYFQGKTNMLPTATSQIIEQFIKLVLGLLLVYLFMPNYSLASGGATLAVTISEYIALLVLFLIFIKHKKSTLPKFKFNKNQFNVKRVVKLIIPITLIGILIPISQTIDSFIIINSLKVYTKNATSLFGIMSGAIASIINLPVALCYGISTTAIPTISKLENTKEKQKLGIKALILTLLVSVISAILLYFFAEKVIYFLYKRFNTEEHLIAVNLLKILCLNVIFISFMQTQNAILIALNKVYRPIISMSIGIAVKTILEIILLKNPNISIYGSAYSLIACYFIICLVNLIMIFFVKANENGKATFNRQQQNKE